MKKFLTSMLCAGMALLALSCSKPDEFKAGEVTVTFSAQIPGVSTKAYSKGENANRLSYAIYDTKDNGGVKTYTLLTELSKTGQNAFATGLTETVPMTLVAGKTYTVYFWADNDQAPYTFAAGANNPTVTISYSGATCNDDKRDAFYGKKVIVVNGPANETVELHRPFAQINFGTNDRDAAADAGLVPTMTSMVVKQAYTTLDLLTETVGAPVDATFAAGPIAERYDAVAQTGEWFPVDGYDYLAMAYVLTDQDNVNLEMTVSDATDDINTIKVSNAPVQANYRTNIYGSLLTSTVKFEVEIKPEYAYQNNPGDLDENINLYRGEVASPAKDDVNKVATISNAAELAGFAKEVKDGNDYNGWTVKLIDDIDLCNYPWAPIGSPEAPFNGTFDGQGHTIYNLTASDLFTRAAVVDSVCGFFGYISSSAIVRNLNIENAVLTGSANVGAIAGYSEGTIENCTVTNASVTASAECAGGIVGKNAGTVSDCEVDDAQVMAASDAGAIVGKNEGSQSGNESEDVEAGVVVTSAAEMTAAYGKAKAGDVIYVKGSFELNGFAVAKSLTIKGIGETQPVLTVDQFRINYTNNVHLDNLAFTYTGTSGTIVYVAGDVTDLSVVNCTFNPSTAFYSQGNMGMLYFQNSVTNLVVDNCTFNRAGFNSNRWCIWGVFKGDGTNYATITNNNFIGGGVDLEGSNPNYKYIKITGNKFTGYRYMRIVTYNDNYVIDSLYIENNTLSKIEIYGYGINTVNDFYFRGNTGKTISYNSTSAEVKAIFNAAIITQ